MKKLLLGTAMLALAGCATLINDEEVAIELYIKDNQSADCVLNNRYGSWEVAAPNRVFVRRSREDLSYSCDLTDGSQLTGIIPTGPSGGIVGNLIFGGVFGAGVDVASEKASTYPKIFIVGESSEARIDADGNRITE